VRPLLSLNVRPGNRGKTVNFQASAVVLATWQVRPSSVHRSLIDAGDVEARRRRPGFRGNEPRRLFGNCGFVGKYVEPHDTTSRASEEILKTTCILLDTSFRSAY